MMGAPWVTQKEVELLHCKRMFPCEHKVIAFHLAVVPTLADRGNIERTGVR